MSRVPFYIALPAGDLDKRLSNITTERIQIFPEEGGVQIVCIAKNQDLGKNKEVISSPHFSFVFMLIEKGVTFANKLSASSNNKWNIWGVMPLGLDADGDGKIDYTWKTGTKIFRRIKQFSKSSSSMTVNDVTKNSEFLILGPWSAKKLYDFDSVLGDKLFYPQIPDKYDINGMPKTFKRDPNAQFRLPWILLGDSPEELGKIDYDPTDEEVDNDIEADENMLFNVKPLLVEEELKKV